MRSPTVARGCLPDGQGQGLGGHANGPLGGELVQVLGTVHKLPANALQGAHIVGGQSDGDLVQVNCLFSGFLEWGGHLQL